MKKLIFSILTLSFIFLFTSCETCVSGVVQLHDGSPFDGTDTSVSIQLENKTVSTTIGKDGTYCLSGVPGGTHTIIASGYHSSGLETGHFYGKIQVSLAWASKKRNCSSGFCKKVPTITVAESPA